MEYSVEKGLKASAGRRTLWKLGLVLVSPGLVDVGTRQRESCLEAQEMVQMVCQFLGFSDAVLRR